MQIPSKIQHGEKVISTVFDKINGIIDYLNASRIRKGPGILVDESPSGTVIKLADNRPATSPQVLPAASGGASGIDAAVSGGTASITLTGGTGSVNMVGTGGVTISGNTNTGNIEIHGSTSGSAGSVGFPDYTHPLVNLGNVAFYTTYPGTEYADQNVWLIGRIRMVADQNQQLAGSLIIYFSDGTNTNSIWLVDTLLDNMDGQEDIPIMFPIPAGVTFELHYNNPPDTLELGIFPCL